MATQMIVYLTGDEWSAIDASSRNVLGHGTLANGRADWSGLRALVARHELRKKLPVRVIIGGDHCHFLSLPWSDALLEPATADRYVQEAFASLFGGVSAAWTIALADAPFGRARLACATDRHCLDGLAELEVDGVIQLESILPSVSAVYESVRRRLSGANGVLGFPDGAGFSLLRWEDHEVAEAEYLPAVPHASPVDDWLARGELAFGDLGTRHWIAAGKGPVPTGWLPVSDGYAAQWVPVLAAMTVRST